MRTNTSNQDFESTARRNGSQGRSEADRVRRFTFKQDLDRIDARTRDALRNSSTLGQAAISSRLAELDREWPVDRALITGAGIFVWLGLILGTTVARRLYGISAVAGIILLVYAFLGWAPPVMILRRLGVRTKGEINLERIALKALRGDFESVSEGELDDETRITRAMEAAV